jgi:protein TonB
MGTSQTSCDHVLKSELARFCLPAANRDSTRKLAWVNSICLLFLLIGLIGWKPGSIRIMAPPPIEQVVPIVIEQPPPPPTRVEAQQTEEQPDRNKPEVPQVVVVTPDSPAIVFSVPTIGNVIMPNALAVAPPANPAKPLVPLRNQITSITSTGSGGERPSPQYPQIAQDLRQEGTVLLSMTVDENGSITSIEVKQSSGFPILDRNALDFVKRHWLLPAGAAGRIFEAPINYTLK